MLRNVVLIIGMVLVMPSALADTAMAGPSAQKFMPLSATRTAAAKKTVLNIPARFFPLQQRKQVFLPLQRGVRPTVRSDAPPSAAPLAKPMAQNTPMSGEQAQQLLSIFTPAD